MSVDSERITFPVSLRKRDRDLMSVFALFASEKGDRSEFARQLMRDGLRYRLEKGIPVGSMRNVEIVELLQAEGGQPASPPTIPANTDLEAIRQAAALEAAEKARQEQAASIVEESNKKDDSELSDEEIDRMLASSKRAMEG